jgi:phenylpropionate dioxygenase-like ring-hydroxylating dioxygenase large terminal subunit
MLARVDKTQLSHNIKMIERMLWHPVALSTDVADKPLAARLLGQDLVVWRANASAGQGAVQAWADKCPHRGAKLSLGRVQTTVQGASTLECAYHGWQFDGAGQCTLVPALPEFAPPAGHCVKTFAAREAYGLVWVQLDAARTALPLMGAAHDARLRTVQCGAYDVATSAPRVVENFLDMAHFGFVREGYLGARDALAMADYTVERTLHGIKATGCRAWQPQSNVHAKRGAEVSYTYEVISPYCAVLTKVPELAGHSAGSTEIDGKAVEWRESIALWVCPITPETSRVWFSYAVADHESPDAVLQEFQNTIFAQDKPILESQSPACLPLDLRSELHTAADKASSAYRRYLQDSGITFGVC